MLFVSLLNENSSNRINTSDNTAVSPFTSVFSSSSAASSNFVSPVSSKPMKTDHDQKTVEEKLDSSNVSTLRSSNTSGFIDKQFKFLIQTSDDREANIFTMAKHKKNDDKSKVATSCDLSTNKYEKSPVCTFQVTEIIEEITDDDDDDDEKDKLGRTI